MKRCIRGAALAALLLTLTPTVTHVARASAPTASAGYTLSVFATGQSGQYYRPDSLTTDGTSIYVGYQNNATNDGTSGSSTIVQYGMDGSVVQTFPVQGHNDGLRVDPSTNLLWSLSNEDANPVLTIIDPGTASETVYSLPTQTPFAGGYDDLAFTPSGIFISVSNPALNHQTVNTRPAIERLNLLPNHTVVLNPVLMGDSMATDATTGAHVKLNLTDPDGLAIDTTGNVVLNDQADSQLIVLRPAGAGPQSVSRLLLQPSGTIVDETTWATSASSTGSFLIADHSNPGTIYRLTKTGGFTAGAAYATVSNDPQPYASSVGTLDTGTGTITPVATGFSSPKGLLFIP
jgi:hypothetical protein